MKLQTPLIISVNLFNLIDCLTTIYGVNVLGFYEINSFARSLICSNQICYVLVKLIPFLFLSYLFCKLTSTEKPLLIGMRIGLIIGFLFAIFVFSIASILNVLQIFGYDVSSVLLFIIRIIPK